MNQIFVILMDNDHSVLWNGPKVFVSLDPETGGKLLFWQDVEQQAWHVEDHWAKGLHRGAVGIVGKRARVSCYEQNRLLAATGHEIRWDEVVELGGT